MIYNDYYELCCKYLQKPNKYNLELGSGSGNFKEYFENIISSDIVFCEWIDVCFDAHNLSFKNNTFDNIVMFDVLHHLKQPLIFLDNVYNILKPRGRILILEPYASFFSNIIFKLFHPEPFDFDIDIFNKNISAFASKSAFSSNQAISQMLFFKYREKFEKLYSDKFNIVFSELLSFFAYPLSGGFENKNLLPTSLIKLLLKLEKNMTVFKYLFAFRCFVALEKK